MASLATDLFSQLLAHVSLLLHSHRLQSFRGAQCEEDDLLTHTVCISALLESLPPEIDLRSMTDPGTPSQYLAASVRRLKKLLSLGCELFGPHNLKIVGPHPIGGGGFSEVWVCERSDGTVVVIKSFRYYSSSSRLPVFLRLYKEALFCGHLSGVNGVNFVQFLGIYCSSDHPFALVFKFVDHGNLGEYLRINQEIRRTELLLQIARGIETMHDCGIIHGNIRLENVFVDGAGNARIGGLGSATVHPHAQTADLDQPPHGSAHELAYLQRRGIKEAEASKASDLRAFATIAWQVFAGQAPPSDGTVVAGTYSASSGRRPARPSHPELSDSVWKLLKGCWKADPKKYKTIGDVITVLEAEASTEN